MGLFGKKRSEEAPEKIRLSGTFLTGDPLKDEDNVRTLLEAIADVSSHMDIDALLRSIVDKSIQVTQAERGLLILDRPGGGESIRVARGRGGEDLTGSLRYSQSISSRVLSARRPICEVVNSDEEALELGQSVFDLKLRTVMCVPLQVKDRLLGAIYVDSRAGSREFSESDLSFFYALSSQLAIALENARLVEAAIAKERMESTLRVARDIQSMLLPSDPSGVRGLDISGWTRPCDVASGDYYDFIELEGGRIGIALGDVTGHGVGAALIMTSTRALWRSLAIQHPDPSAVLARINAFVAHDMQGTSFVSFLYGILDPGRKTFAYASAGQTPGLWLRHDGSPMTLENTGPALGLVPGESYLTSEPLELASGDLLCLYTDGIAEAQSPAQEFFGRARIEAAVRENRDLRAPDLNRKIFQSVERFVAGCPIQDDLTLVTIKVL